MVFKEMFVQEGVRSHTKNIPSLCSASTAQGGGGPGTGGDTVGGWGQAGSSDLWLLARREAESGEGLQAQGSRCLLCSLQGFSAARCWGEVCCSREVFAVAYTALPGPGNHCPAQACLQGRTAEPEEEMVLVRRFKERAKTPFRALERYKGCSDRVLPDLGSHERCRRGLFGVFSLFFMLVYAD